MAEPVQSQIRRRISRSVVCVTVTYPPGDKDIFGIVIGLSSKNAIVITCGHYFYEEVLGIGVTFEYEKILVDTDDILFNADIVMIPVSIPEGFDITDVEEIPLCETLPSLHENIHLFSPEYCRVTSGNIIGTTSDIAFQCNPCISEDSEFGAPLLNNSFELIGMSTGYGRLYLTAISSISIARAIERTQGRQFQGVQHALQHLRSNRL